MLYDAFISHASEDKDDFVRALAERLREEHVEVWYDEFSLRIGDSLRRSIDKGLSQSRFGIVVLSPSFFAKGWAQREFDGLVAREIDEQGIVLPVWHGVTREDVKSFSPPLADKLAASSADGIERVVRQLCDAIRPEGSTLVIARDRVIEMGYKPPVVTDDWWLDVAAASEPNDMEGGFQSAMGWGRWGFPLPESSREPAERGFRLARAAMQMEWQRDADEIPITQITPPEQVHAFIESAPGLADVCHEYPYYLCVYAPQLVIPGFGGQFEELFEDLYQMSLADESRTGRDPHFHLRDPSIGAGGSKVDASNYFHGYGAQFGPSADFYRDTEHVAWLLSDSSTFLPEAIRAGLTLGMAEWGVWTWNEHELNPLDRFGYERVEYDGFLQRALSEADSMEEFRPSPKAVADAAHRMSFSARLLGLPESGDELAERLLAPAFLVPYFSHRESRRRDDEND